MRRLAWLALAAGPLGCGILFAPGELLGGGSGVVTASDAGADADVTQDGEDASARDANAPAGVRVVLVGGHRQPLAGETGGANVAETMRATLSPDGALGPWEFDLPPPLATSWTRATIAGGALFVHDASRYARAPFTDRVDGAWTTAAIPSAPPLPNLRPWLLSEHGFLAGASLSGLDKTTHALRFEADGGLGAWTAGAAVAVQRAEVTLARAGDLVYAVGGRDFASGGLAGRSDIEVGKLDPNGALGPLTKVSDLGLKSGSGTLLTAYAPVVATGAGRIAVLGGTVASATNEPTNRAVVASIADPATGAVGDWTTLTPLPAPLVGFGAVVTNRQIVVFGGATPTGLSDAVLALDVNADGTYGTEWRTIGTLPGPRSGIAAVSY